jgi:hypothetical protein
MATKYQRGVLIDVKGRFLAAIQWDASKPPPNFNVPKIGEKRVRPDDRKFIVTTDAALAGIKAGVSAWWRFDKAADEWVQPSQGRYLIDERGNLRGSVVMFPDDPIPPIRIEQEGYQWITDAPPQTKSSRRPLYRDGAWVVPSAFCVVNPAGVIKAVAVAVSPDDLNLPDRFSAIPRSDITVPSAPNEADRPAIIGDTVDVATKTVTARAMEPSPKITTELFLKILQSKNLLTDFVTYAQTQGVTAEQIRNYKGEVTADIKLIRDWATGKGFARPLVVKVFRDALELDKDERNAAWAQKGDSYT